jgi:hypothetical protein
MSDEISLLSLSNEHNPILSENGLPHLLKLMVIEEGKWLMRNNHVNNVKSFQKLVINAWNNNLEYGIDELNDYFNDCKTQVAKTDYLDNNIKNYMINIKNNKQIYYDWQYESLNRYNSTIKDYCDYLKKNNSNNNGGGNYTDIVNEIMNDLKLSHSNESVKDKLLMIKNSVKLLVKEIGNSSVD